MSANYRMHILADKNRMKDVISFIDNNVGRKLTAELVAERTGFNKSTLNRYFLLIYRLPISRVILDSKMKKAHDLIMENDKLISEVAHLLGYKNCSAFTHAFTRYFGYTPMQLLNSRDT